MKLHKNKLKGPFEPNFDQIAKKGPFTHDPFKSYSMCVYIDF